jgi:hypothetical protein
MRAVILVLLALILPATTLRAQPRLPPIAWLSDRDGDYDVYVWDGEQTINVSNNDSADIYIQPFPDGQFAWLGIVSDRSEVFVWDGEQTLNVSNSPSYDYFPVWSNDGRLAWYTDQSDERGTSLQVAVWDGEQTMLLGREFGWTDSAYFSADGGQLSPVWSEDGRLAWLTVGTEGVTHLYVWDSAQVIRIAEFADKEPLYLTWLPNGHLLILNPLINSDDTASLWLWDGDHVTPLLEPTSGIIEWTLWGDSQLAFRVGTRADAPVYIWTETGAVRINPEHSGLVGYPSGSSQGQIAWIAEIDGTPTPRLYVWDGAVVHDVGRADDSFPGPRWSADGRLAWNTQTADGMHIYVWDGETISDIPPDENHYDSELMWLPDGRLAWQAGDYPAQELKSWDRGRIGTITIGVGPIRDVRVFLAGLLWTQEIDGNSDVFFWDTTQTINVSHDPGWDGLTLVPAMG